MLFICKNSKNKSSLGINKKHIQWFPIHKNKPFLLFFGQKTGGPMQVPISEDFEILLMFDDFLVSI